MTRGLLLTGSLNDHLKPRVCTLYVLKIVFMHQNKLEKETVIKKVIRKRKCTYGMALYLRGKMWVQTDPRSSQPRRSRVSSILNSDSALSLSRWHRRKGGLYTKNTQTHFLMT